MEHALRKQTWACKDNHLRLVAILVAVAFAALGFSQLSWAKRGVSSAEHSVNVEEDKVVVLKNTLGVEVHILTLGAVVQKLLVPDKHGDIADVVLGFDDSEPYEDGTSPYFGAVVGRVANRIADAKFSLAGRNYSLVANDPPNSLHGGLYGWSRRKWTILNREVFDDGGSAVQLGYTSQSMEEGYPGTISAKVTYSLVDVSTLQVNFEATSDAATPLNMAQHTYFNLNGVASESTILGHIMQINSSYVTPVDATRIPTGEFETVEGTPFDFSGPTEIGSQIHHVPGPPPLGYDINYVLWGMGASEALQQTKDCSALKEPAVAVAVHSPATGRKLEVLTSSPGLQFYSGNQLDGTLKGKAGVLYPRYGGFALETQMFPNFVNEPRFPQCILTPGKEYRTSVSWRFSVQ